MSMEHIPAQTNWTPHRPHCPIIFGYAKINCCSMPYLRPFQNKLCLLLFMPQPPRLHDTNSNNSMLIVPVLVSWISKSAILLCVVTPSLFLNIFKPSKLLQVNSLLLILSSMMITYKLKQLYANRARSRIMDLKERHTLMCRDSKPVEYLQTVKAIAGELALIDTLINDDYLILHILNSVGVGNLG
ncbi:hypothetical protein ACFX2G_020456 [Malus domestica]